MLATTPLPLFFFFNDTATTEIYTLSLHDALPICLEAGHDTYWDGFSAKYGNLNLCTFSIEHVDVTIDNSETPTQAQLNSSFSLVLWLCQQFGVTADRIKPHSSLDPITRALCPGNYPLDSLLTYIRRNLVNPNM